jgi:L-asparaginase
MTTKVLIVYTGGTIGMKQDSESLALVPFNFNQILQEVPELRKFNLSIDAYSFDPAIDSSDVRPQFWVELAELIRDSYSKYDGFVVLHGTDTMAFTASMLSFMLENLEKPVILTGSQLPIGVLRTDGRENLISSIEIAASQRPDGRPCVPEVCVFFDNELYRGNRTYKYSAEFFNAFKSPNYPLLAEAGIHINFNEPAIRFPESWGRPLRISTKLDTRVGILKLYPGMPRQYVDTVLSTKGMRALVIETFGCGNAPGEPWLLDKLRQAVDEGIVVVNVTQCAAGSVDMDAYATGMTLRNIGIISAYDSTFESALTKLYYLLGKYDDNETVKRKMSENIRGEFSKKQ